MYANLHMHSTYSDGTDTPLELLSLAREHRVSVVSVTDHDTVDGVNSLGGLGAAGGPQVIPGIEISCIVNRKMLHVLGYYIDIHSAALDAFLARMSEEKTENTQVNFHHAVSLGAFNYPWERVVALSPGQRRLSGVHVMKAMKADGYDVPGMTHREMFYRFFMPSGDGFIDTQKMGGYEAIEIIRRVGGIPVIAHPKSVGDDSKVLDLLDHGAEGLEVYHPTHTPAETQKYLRMATERGCFITGGSDWHGGNNGPEVTSFTVTGLDRADYPILNARSAVK